VRMKNEYKKMKIEGECSCYINIEGTSDTAR